MTDDQPAEPAERHRRRHRRRATAPQGPPQGPVPEPVAEPVAAAPVAAAPVAAAPVAAAPVVASAPERREKRPDKPRTAKRAPRDAPNDRGLRDLVGAGRSQVGVGGALRARDLNRPTDEELAAAEAEVEIVRRHWKPRAGD